MVLIDNNLRVLNFLGMLLHGPKKESVYIFFLAEGSRKTSGMFFIYPAMCASQFRVQYMYVGGYKWLRRFLKPLMRIYSFPRKLIFCVYNDLLRNYSFFCLFFPNNSCLCPLFSFLASPSLAPGLSGCLWCRRRTSNLVSNPSTAHTHALTLRGKHKHRYTKELLRKTHLCTLREWNMKWLWEKWTFYLCLFLSTKTVPMQ